MPGQGLVADQAYLDIHPEIAPLPVRGERGYAQTPRQGQTGAIAEGQPRGAGRGPDLRRGNDIGLLERGDPRAEPCQRLASLLCANAAVHQLGRNLGRIDRGKPRARQVIPDLIGTRLAVEHGEHGRGIEHDVRHRALPPFFPRGFGPTLGQKLVDQTDPFWNIAPHQLLRLANRDRAAQDADDITVQRQLNLVALGHTHRR